jgi:hypothetical protein
MGENAPAPGTTMTEDHGTAALIDRATGLRSESETLLRTSGELMEETHHLLIESQDLRRLREHAPAVAAAPIQDKP